MKNLTCVFISPTIAAPMVVKIPSTLEALQEAVDGYVETVEPAILRDHNVIMVVNEEGRIRGYAINRNATYCFSGLKNKYLSAADPRVILGNALIIGVDGDEWVSLSEDDIMTLQLRMSEVCDMPFTDWRWL